MKVNDAHRYIDLDESLSSMQLQPYIFFPGENCSRDRILRFIKLSSFIILAKMINILEFFFLN